METLHAVEVDGMVIEPQSLHDRFLTGAPQCQKQGLIRVGHHIVGPGMRTVDHQTVHLGQTAALGMRGDDMASARPSAARRYIIFITSTYCATDSRATGLSG